MKIYDSKAAPTRRVRIFLEKGVQVPLSKLTLGMP